jgi:DNA replication protein DnaC
LGRANLFGSCGREAIPALKELDFLKEHNIILNGNSGTGKTHLAIALGIRDCEENYRVAFCMATGLIRPL